MQFTSTISWDSILSLGLNTYWAFPFLCSLSAGVLPSSPSFCHPSWKLSRAAFFYFSGKGGITANSFSFLIFTWRLSAFHPHSCCVSNAEPQLQHLSPVSCFCSFSWVRIITSLGYSQLPLKSRELIESQTTKRRASLFHVGLNTVKLVQCDIHFKQHFKLWQNSTSMIKFFFYLVRVFVRLLFLIVL